LVDHLAHLGGVPSVLAVGLWIGQENGLRILPQDQDGNDANYDEADERSFGAQGSQDSLAKGIQTKRSQPKNG